MKNDNKTDKGDVNLSENKKAKKSKIIILFFAAIILLAASVAVIKFSDRNNNFTFDETTASNAETSDETEESTEAEKPSVENNVVSESTTKEKRSESGRIIVDVEATPWNLIVVNMEREIPEGYDPETAEILDTGYSLDARVTPYYEEMYLAAKEEGIILTPFSGHRSYERQRINYENLTETYMQRYGLDRDAAAKKAATVILPPGTSEHNIGLAMDVCNTYDSFADSAEYAWLMENAYKYGFILRYPKEKEDITGIVFEPWHWRFVGVEYAKKIKDSGLCLEEYLNLV